MTECREKKVSQRFGLVAVLLVAICASVARSEQLPVKHYTTADGLGSSKVTHIFQDSRGFLWFSTRDGLSRFDGYSFVTYDTRHGLSAPTINYLIETRAGVYWVATNGGGVCRFNPDAGRAPARADNAAAPQQSAPLFTPYRVGDTSVTNRVNVLYEDRNNRLWAGTDDGLFRLEKASDGREEFRRVLLGGAESRPGDLGVWGVGEDAEGTLWVGSFGGVARLLPGGRVLHYPVAPAADGDPVRDLMADREGRIWIVHRRGLFMHVPEPAAVATAAASTDSRMPALSATGARRFTTADGLPDGGVRYMYQSADGRLWFGTSGGLSVFDGRDFRNYTTAQGLSDNVIGRMFEDRDGNLWVSAYSGGVMRLALNGMVSYTESDGLGRGLIHSIYEDETGALVVVSDNWFVNRFEEGRFKAARLQMPPDAAVYWTGQAGFLDREGEWWMASDHGLVRFGKPGRFDELAQRKPRAVYTSRDGLLDDTAFMLFEDSRGDLWVSTVGGNDKGLVKWERATATFRVYGASDGLPLLEPTNSPTAFEEDKDGRLWIGFNDGGLLRYASGRFDEFTTDDGLPSGAITALHRDQLGRLWIATNQGGLARVDDTSEKRPRFKTYTTDEGLSSNNVRCVTEDLDGRIYAGTARGVDRLDPATGRLRHYTLGEGLVNDFLTTAFRDREGALWFGTLNGLSRLVPEAGAAPAAYARAHRRPAHRRPALSALRTRRRKCAISGTRPRPESGTGGLLRRQSPARRGLALPVHARRGGARLGSADRATHDQLRHLAAGQLHFQGPRHQRRRRGQPSARDLLFHHPAARLATLVVSGPGRHHHDGRRLHDLSLPRAPAPRNRARPHAHRDRPARRHRREPFADSHPERGRKPARRARRRFRDGAA